MKCENDDIIARDVVSNLEGPIASAHSIQSHQYSILTNAAAE